MRKSAVALVMAASIAAAASGPARAQDRPQEPQITIEQAIKVARDAGFVMIREIELDDGKWEVKGRTQAGERRELHIDAASGKVLRNELD